MTLAAVLAARRKKEAMEHIALVALELFERDGFEATSVEAIASAVGCSTRTVYRYFGTKEDVLFHDLPTILEEVGEVLDGHLAAGLQPWDAVTETYTGFISRFDETDPEFPTRRMRLCLSEPALRARYQRYVHDAEEVVGERLHRHRGTSPLDDDLPQLIAVAATGAYRVTLFTHGPFGSEGQLDEHLRRALTTFERGFGSEA